ncbi:MAG TPA: (d)CMP kinase [Bacteroidetes bacterium]|nr:(d)CMP kinase [Bacteroidota bacterium]
MTISPDQKLIIAVDGHSSSGKSTFARAIAEELGYVYIDSGAMYRAVTLFAIENGMISNGEPDEEALTGALYRISIRFEKNADGTQRTLLNGRDVEKEIRNMQVSELVSPVSRIREVRRKMVELQRKLGEKGGIVMDGRDIGTTVFPRADIKIFLTSDPETRAKRRYRELLGKGIKTDFQEVLKNINERDRIDQSREESPLKQAHDAILLDNSHMTPEEQMDWFRELLKKKYHADRH